ncbi:monocarboxylate transporter 12-like [Acanthaster planci]|uniref:Monocarboxylate transporter 12-like n=1 Tax=Acanthaster planci TaxID=133434 RepID=A0A8B7YYY9_ACAPL|nr:monocarboxylate transporter 12-like [Acanthaster planci]XP_022098565.1 monocarboxylate transporter 12-like [Acanthaster planci]XP_022098566.1 monocarboxylate transporter 12-like [Acanthaster planci]XP_022098567.1 monocarboxylate transporter 12-like [Acanthaster planci]
MGVRCGNASWYAVLCVHFDWLLWAGLLKGLGVLLPTLQEQFTAEAWMIGGLIATVTGVGSVAGPFSRPLEAMFGTRIVVTVSGLLLGASVIVSSFTFTAIQMTLALALIAGPCLMISNILSRAMMGRHFTTNYATVNGVATAGYSVGLIFIGPLTQLLLDTYGWRGALLLLGALSMHLGVCGFLLRSPSPPAEVRHDYLPISSSVEEPSDEESKSPNPRRKSRLRVLMDAIKVQGNLFGCGVCGRLAFWTATLVYAEFQIVSSLWLIYFVAYAESKGFSGYEAVTFITAGGIGNLIFKILAGLVVDRGWLKLRLALLISILISGFTQFTLPWLNSYWLIMANALIFNGFVGAEASLTDIYTRELLGAEDLVSTFSWMDLVTAIIQIACGFFPGWIFDQTGSYDKAFVIFGFISLLPLGSLFMEKLRIQ